MAFFQQALLFFETGGGRRGAERPADMAGAAGGPRLARVQTTAERGLMNLTFTDEELAFRDEIRRTQLSWR